MAGDAQDSRRKHRRTLDEEEEESSKRRKHRHHHSHHRYHHRRSSRKHEEDDDGGREAEDMALPPPPLLPTSHAVVAPVVAATGSNSRPDYEMEEGEIVEDEGFCVVDAEDGKRKGDSDFETSQIEMVDIRDESGLKNLEDNAEEDPSNYEAQGDLGFNLSSSPKKSGKNGRNSRTLGEEKSGDDLVVDSTTARKDKRNEGCRIDSRYDELCSGDSPESDANGVVSHFYFKENNRLHGALFPSGKKDKYKASRSRSHEKYHDKAHDEARSRSRDGTEERFRSQSILQEAMMCRREQDDAVCADSSKAENESENGGTTGHFREHRHGSKDLLRDEEREHSVSYSSRYYELGERHHSQETRGRDKEERDRKRRKEQDKGDDRGTSRGSIRGRELDSRDWEIVLDRRREKEQDRSRDSEWIRERDKDREKERDRNRDKAEERDTHRERERGRSADKARGRVRVREQNRSWDRTRERDRDRDRDWNRDKEREKERDRERDRNWERVREREMDGGREINRGRGRNTEREMVSRNHKYENLGGGNGEQDMYKNSSRYLRHSETEYQRNRTKKNDSSNGYSAENDLFEKDERRLKRDEDEQEEYQERIALQLAEQEEEDLDRIKEESRRRRQAILEKYKTRPSLQQVQVHSEDLGKDKGPAKEPDHQSVAPGANIVPEILDGRTDGVDVFAAEPSFSVGKSPLQNGNFGFEKISGAGGLGEGTPKSERSDDLLCDDIFGESPAGVRKSSERSDDLFCDDIFGESPAGVRKSGKGEGFPVEKSGLHDNWDDAEGYYSFRFGEILDGRYEVTAAHGKGVFSTVVRAKDLKAGNGEPEEVAIKIIRNNDTMYKAGMQELVILNKLVGADPDNRRHCVRFISHFKYRNHLCLVFESLHMNLREVLKKFGRNIGLKLTAIRAYAKQLFIGLKHLRNCGVLHCDIKPDNMLVNEAKNVLKLCDFGNAMFAGKNEITPYLVSRFYRAPEIILGLPYDHPLDIWSVGCCLYELYTGKVLFPGPSNNDMLRLHMELKGPFPKKMLRKGAFTDQHFDQDLNFHATEEDPVTKKTIKRLILNVRPKDIGTIVSSCPGEDPKMSANFKDLLDKIFVLDPEKRMTVSQALNHPFITGK